MGILDGKNILITGVLSYSSIAFEVARVAQDEGAEVVLTSYGRRSLVERVAARLPKPPPVVDLDVTDTEQLDSLAERVGVHLDGLDGVLHAVAFAPPGALGGAFLRTAWEDAATTLQVSTFSLQALSTAVLPMLRPGSAIVAMDYDDGGAFPSYDWMGVAKSGLESCARYLAYYLGPNRVRVNLVAAGPLWSVAASHIPGFKDSLVDWDERAPLGWRPDDRTAVARACAALLSDWFPATTGEIVHVDGGRHAMGH
ncbi:enoyl-[acyl-carrier-protein] reductase FabI [Actinomadura sp. GC306]|uniref:enoyl-ACP reductase FabI n=1 Tax=Actinomadura sp. GC306 TaxID=2530367 RepID=UPI0010496943|nr:enoyl-ACP reductase FabI [Actinomadura sp. GC306]TDC70300.1 enoyl-[acyl-carrier-protein] reductase FabI [Actinomadura sp. GC306]